MAQNRKDYYKFIAKNALRGLIWFAAIVGIYLVFDYAVGDRFEEWAKPLQSKPILILGIFFASETLFGLIPLEFFVIWAGKFQFETFLLLLFVLSILSYISGIIAYYLGKKIKDIPVLTRLLERESFQKYIKLYRRYGGILIILAGLTPLPDATISMISASLGFPFKRYLLYSAARFLKFFGVGVFVWMSGI